jgi:TolB protein
MAAERSGRWEIYTASTDGVWEQITSDYSPARAPALSPDGKQVAFQSHKDGNWEVYTIRLDSKQAARITNDPAYDGAPSWSPDGSKIAFESYRSDDLDIWVANADGSNPVNLTSQEPAYDYGPAWSPHGNWIAYTSWSTGHKQVFITSTDGQQHLNISQDQFDDEQPAWSPDGKQLAFVSNREGCEHVTDTIALNACQRQEIYVADFDGTRLLNVRQVTFGGHDSAPVWSPDGQYIAFISPRPDRQVLYLTPASGGTPSEAIAQADGLSPQPWVSSAAWGALQVTSPDPLVSYPPLYVEKPIAASVSDGHPYQMQELKEIYLAPSWGQMSSRVANSLRTLRARIKQEVGYDFLSTLSDMTRELKAPCGVSCDNLSWHKSGRAIDTRLEYANASGQSMLELVREDLNGETYWRLYLRAAVQDGSMGEPLKDAPWDFSYRARWQIAPDQGGIEERLPYGYYVDFTEIAREYGWGRISSHDDPDFDWRSNKLATEYWHYQKTDGLGWYDAMQELYSTSDLNGYLEWNKVIRDWQVQEMRLYFKGLPAPPTAWKWFALIPPNSAE